MASQVYWIRHNEHTDMTCQGYIGVSVDSKIRWRDHKNCPSNQHMKNAVAKYGWDNLVKEVILIADDAYCLMIEAKLRPTENIGWNIAIGGGKPPITRWNLGKTLSQETRDKISRNRTGKKHTPEMQARLNLNLTEGGKETRFQKGHVSHNKGKHLSEETRAKIGAANKGNKLPPETIARIAAANTGKKRSDEFKERMRLLNLGRKPPMKGKQFPDVECPHCGKIGRLTGMKSWHFDNCRQKEAA